MTCCQKLIDGHNQQLPFIRTLALGYHDGPIEGLTACSQCGQAWSFRKLDWDDSQNMRVFAFAPLTSSLEIIASQLGTEIASSPEFVLIPPLSEAKELFVQNLLASPPTRITACEGWPGICSIWRKTTVAETSQVKDWVSFLRLQR